MESDNPDIQGLYDIIEEWWESCYEHAKGNIVDTISLALGEMPLGPGEEMRLHFKEKVYVIKREE